jgi:hypothetical protein
VLSPYGSDIARSTNGRVTTIGPTSSRLYRETVLVALELGLRFGDMAYVWETFA